MARQRDAVLEMDGADGPSPNAPPTESQHARGIPRSHHQRGRAVLLGDQIGSLREGKLTDLVIFDVAGSLAMSCVAESDPVVRHSDARDVEAVIIDGVWRKKYGKICPITVKETGDALEWPSIRDKLLESQRGI